MDGFPPLFSQVGKDLQLIGGYHLSGVDTAAASSAVATWEAGVNSAATSYTAGKKADLKAATVQYNQSIAVNTAVGKLRATRDQVGGCGREEGQP